MPVALGRKLRDAAPPGVRWVEIAGGSHSRLHTDAPEIYRQALESLIERAPGRRPETREPASARRRSRFSGELGQQLAGERRVGEQPVGVGDLAAVDPDAVHADAHRS